MLVIFIFILTGCSVVPLASPKEDTITKQFPLSSDHAVVYVFRDQVLAGSAIAATLFLDGKLTGGINDHDFRTMKSNRESIS